MDRAKYQDLYEINPIMLEGGIAGAGPIPLSTVLSAAKLDNGLYNPVAAGEYFGNFRILPGGTLIANEIAMYPFANQGVAANAVITDPLEIAVEMLVPASAGIGVGIKKQIMTLLKTVLDTHIAYGGWFNISTPSYDYQGCLLKDLTDQTDNGAGSQVQVRWVFTFVQPLITNAQLQASQNQLLRKISNRTKNAGNPPGSQPLVTDLGAAGTSITQNVVPSATGASNIFSGSGLTPNGAPALETVAPIQPGQTI